MLTLLEAKALADKLPEEFQQLREAAEMFKDAKINLDRALEKLRSVCTHPIVMERDYLSYEFVKAAPPRRRCQLCGIEEEGPAFIFEVLAAGQRSRYGGDVPEEVSKRVVVKVDVTTYNNFRIGQDPLV